MRIAKILALAVAGGMVLLPTRYLAEEQPAAETNVSTDLSSRLLYPLPFSFARVLAYFNKVFGERPSKSDAGSYAYIDLDNPDEVVIITVTELQTSLGVVLLATGDYGVNYIREFFEAPFSFARRPNSYTSCSREVLGFDRSALNDSLCK
jgi:hypothetical protein